MGASKVETDELQAEFLTHFGRLVMSWNRLELIARDMLTRIGPRGWTLHLLANQIGNVSLTACLKETAKLHGIEQLPAIIHFCNLMDTLRPYRNHYAHNLHSIWTVEGSPIGQVYEIESKEKLYIIEETVTASQIYEVAQKTFETVLYGFAITVEIDPDFASRVNAGTILPSLHERPPLPEKLKKHRQGPREWSSRGGSSPR